MYQGMYQEYLDNEILTAEPIKLVQLMYRGALEAVGAARRALAAGDIPTRSQKISKASELLNELALSLDHSKDPVLCKNLVELYDYMLRRLIEGNSQQTDAPLAEVEQLLGSLLQAWIEAAGASTAPVAVPPAAYGVETAEYSRVSYAY
jgi:flagellar protein FliS